MLKVGHRAILAVLTLTLAAAGALAEEPQPSTGHGLTTAEHEWLRSEFGGGFHWALLSPETGEPMQDGEGECRMQFGGLFLECRQFSPSGETISVALMGFDSQTGKFQRVHWSGAETSILYGEGVRDPAGNLVIEGVQTPQGAPAFDYRAVMRKGSAGEWTYTHYRVDGDQQTVLFRARLTYASAASRQPH